MKASHNMKKMKLKIMTLNFLYGLWLRINFSGIFKSIFKFFLLKCISRHLSPSQRKLPPRQVNYRSGEWPTVLVDRARGLPHKVASHLRI